jgi:thiol-disulfide isomerase/thioredoxin
MIKKGLLLVGIIGLIFSCEKSAPKDYATLSGKIDNVKSKELVVKSRGGYVKSIKINDDGSFSDTLHIGNKGEMFIFSADETSQIFLKNDDDIKINADAKNLKETLKFSGKGAKTSNYLAKKIRLQSKFDLKNLFKLERAEFDKQAKEISTAFTNLMNKNSDIDADFFAEEKEGLESLPQMLNERYNQVNTKKTSFNGKPSPEFNNYENYKGGKTSLKDLRGKYVYVDVWATWCRPCLGEIPHLQKLEEEFKGKNIKFVSISVDRETAKEAWRKMIAAKKMGGIQLFAPKGDSFAKEFKINSIPRFILIDPNGNVVKENMTRPSDPSTKEFLKKLVK